MNLFKFAFLTASLVLPVTALAQGTLQTYHYEVRVPAGSGTCQSAADHLKAQFASNSLVTNSPLVVTSSVCSDKVSFKADGKTYQAYVLVLTYQSDRPVARYAASFASPAIGSVPSMVGGFYDTYDACLADIAVQTQNFQAATELPAIAAFCNPAEGIEHNVYRLEIDGLGTPAQTLYVFSAAFLGQEDAATKTDVHNLIVNLGGSVTKDLGNQVYYYAKSSLNIDNTLMGFFENSAECTSQLTDAQTIATKAQAQNVIARCLPLEAATPQDTSSFALEVVSDSHGLSQDFGMNHKYYSFSECMNDKPNVLTDLGKWAYGGICSPSLDTTGQYTLNIFEKY